MRTSFRAIWTAVIADMLGFLATTQAEDAAWRSWILAYQMTWFETKPVSPH